MWDGDEGIKELRDLKYPKLDKDLPFSAFS
jgi:hypothetical protein